MQVPIVDIGALVTPALEVSLGQWLDFLTDDEPLEVTPKGWRLRKRLPSQDDRGWGRKREQVGTSRG